VCRARHLDPPAGRRHRPELLRVPVATLRWWRHKGIGPRSFKLGRHVLYERSDLDAWIDAQRGEVA
jgi:hypothetical protein